LVRVLASEVGLNSISAVDAADNELVASNFVSDGFVLIRDLVDLELVSRCNKMLVAAFNDLKLRAENNQIELDVHGFAITIMDQFSKTLDYEALVGSPKLLNLLQVILGPDIGILGFDALWINAPREANPVLLKNQHVDAWTGTSINTLFVKFFFTDVDEYNSVSVSPGSHLQGLIPVRNRAIDPSFGAEFDEVNLDIVRQGDVLIWHPLLVHSTTGNSKDKIRVSMTSRYKSTETIFSSQERALGCRTLRVGPMLEILRLIGNDYLLPGRTLGGSVQIDRRMSYIYGKKNKEENTDYSVFTKKFFRENF